MTTSIMSRFDLTGKVIRANSKLVNFSLRPKFKSFEQMHHGYLMYIPNPSGKGQRPVWFLTLPSSPVLKWLTPEQYRKEKNSINASNVKQETLLTGNGGSITIQYIKNHGRKTW